ARSEPRPARPGTPTLQPVRLPSSTASTSKATRAPPRQRVELSARIGTQDHRALIDGVVDREDPRPVGIGKGQAAQVALGEQRVTLDVGQLLPAGSRTRSASP